MTISIRPPNLFRDSLSLIIPVLDADHSLDRQAVAGFGLVIDLEGQRLFKLGFDGMFVYFHQTLGRFTRFNFIGQVNVKIFS